MSSSRPNPDSLRREDPAEPADARRTAYVGTLIAGAGAALARALKRLGAAMERGYAEELDRRAVEADAFLRRSVPRY